MNILFISAVDQPGGVFNAMRNMLVGLNNSSHKTRLLLRANHSLGPYLEQLVSAGTQPAFFDYQPDSPFRSLYNLYAAIRSINPDLVHFHLCHRRDPFRKYVIFSKLINRKVIMQEHLPTAFSGKPGLWENMADRISYKTADAVITVSWANKRFLMKTMSLAEDKVTVLPNSVDTDVYRRTANIKTAREQLQIDMFNKVVVMIGSMENNRKGHSVLIEAAPKILKECPDTVFVMAGRGALQRSFENSVQAAGMQRHFRFLGFRHDVPSILNAADVLALPSFDESFGLVIAEAMAVGLPVVATRVGGIPEIVEDGATGFMVPPGDTDILAEKVTILLRYNDKAAAMGKAGNKRVNELFSLSHISRKLLDSYRGILDR